MGTHRCLAYIWPVEPIEGKETALANIRCMNGPFAHKILESVLTTRIYTYYYWGVTFEAVTLSESGEVLEIGDVTKEDVKTFGMDMVCALTFNNMTHEVLASDGFVYKLDQSLFYRNCKQICEYIYKEIETANNFTLRMYTVNGAVAALLFDKNLTPDAKGYKFAIHRGFVTADNSILRTMVPKTALPERSNDILKQPEIDKLIEEYEAFNKDTK